MTTEPNPAGSRFTIAKHLRTRVREILGPTRASAFVNSDIDIALKHAAEGKHRDTALGIAARQAMSEAMEQEEEQDRK